MMTNSLVNSTTSGIAREIIVLPYELNATVEQTSPLALIAHVAELDDARMISPLRDMSDQKYTSTTARSLQRSALQPFGNISWCCRWC